MLWGVPLWAFWLFLSVILLVVEAITVMLVTIWFVPPALLAMVAALFGAGLGLQLLIMLLGSILSLWICYSYRRRLNVGRYQRVETNADRLIGQVGSVVKTIGPLEARGQVRVDGELWTAVAADPDWTFAVGDRVCVREIQGVKVLVDPAPTQPTI